jgi:16S rRNA (guanine966-N2)-methyltransferase
MNRLRITGGFLRGRYIALMKGGSARYSSSKIREAIFDLIGSVEGCTLLDLFTGSGSFTIEALSRGAAAVTCVESEVPMVRILEENLRTLSLNKYCHVLNMDVRYAIPFLRRRACMYDVIFMDPPYERGWISSTIALLETEKIYHKDTIFILEHSRREVIDPSALDGWNEVTRKRYGDTCLTLIEAHETNDTMERSLT